MVEERIKYMNTKCTCSELERVAGVFCFVCFEKLEAEGFPTIAQMESDVKVVRKNILIKDS